MAYIIVRNSTSGYVSCVEKRRVPTPGGRSSVRDVGRVCGLGVMSQADFLRYQAWAHSMKDQEMRRRAVLNSSACVANRNIAEEKVSQRMQKKTTVKAKPTVQTGRKRTRAQQAVRQSYPVPTLAGAKGRDAGKTHTQVMQEREKSKAMEAAMRKEGVPETKKWKPKPYFEPGMGKGKGKVSQ